MSYFSYLPSYLLYIDLILMGVCDGLGEDPSSAVHTVVQQLYLTVIKKKTKQNKTIISPERSCWVCNFATFVWFHYLCLKFGVTVWVRLGA